MVLKLCLCSRRNISPGNPEGADQPKTKGDSVPKLFIRELIMIIFLMRLEMTATST